MKKIILAAMACMLACAVSSQTVWFFPAAGKTNSYRTTATTVMGGQNLYSSIYVAESDAGKRVVVSDVFQNAGDAKPTQSVATTYRLSGDNWTVDFSESLLAALSSLGEITVDNDSGSMTYPCEPKKGQTFDDIKVRMSIKIQGNAVAVEAEVKDRKIAAEETVEVPAGKFKCLRFEETTVTSLMGQQIMTRSETWIAEGIGVVKQKTDMMNGAMTVVMELTGIKDR